MSILRDLCNFWWGPSRYRPPVVYLPQLDRLKHHTTLLETFELSFCDTDAANFLQRASQGSLWKLVLARFLYSFFSFTLVNGMLNTAQMYVVSSEQLRRLLRPEGCEIHHGRRQRDTTTSSAPSLPSSSPAAASETGTPGLGTDTTTTNNSTSAATTTRNRKTKVHYTTSTSSSSSSSSSSSVVPAAVRKLEEDPAAVASLPTPRFGRILDIGAGDGNVTSRLLPFCAAPADICVTEASASMRYRLKQRGFTVLNCEDPYHDPVTGERQQFDLITCFNLLDRIDTPQSMLNDCRDSLRPGGYLLLAVVLPWCPFVECGSRQKRPREQLPMKGGECCKGASYEQSLEKLVENVLVPTGFELVRWTRLPYLCEGDLKLDYAVLNDAVMVLKVKEDATKSSSA